MWPFSTDERRRQRLNRLESRLSDVEDALATLGGSLKTRDLAISHQLAALTDRLHRLTGKVYGENGAVQRAEKNVPEKILDTKTKNQLRLELGIRPGVPWKPNITSNEE